MLMRYQLCNVCKKTTSEGFYTLINHAGDSSLYNNEEYKHYHDDCVSSTQQKTKSGRFNKDGVYWACNFSRE